MASTRGATAKFKFGEGERVLCFEPDPTKARVLYDAKVLESREKKDSRGRKAVEYLIHFQGWNSSWDRYVAESYILKCNEENRLLQKELAEAARSLLKEKSKRKRGKAATKSRSESEISNDEGESATRSSFGDDLPSCEEGLSESEEFAGNKESIIVTLPNSLKSFMEEDFLNITQRKKLHRLPEEPCVAAVLESFVRNYAYNLVCKSLEKTRSLRNSTSSNTSQGASDSSSVSNMTSLSLCKEVADGLRVSFDFLLPLTLLYAKEREQYEKFVTSFCANEANEDSEGLNQDGFARKDAGLATESTGAIIDNPLVNDAAQWRILPSNSCDQFLPCKVYGAAHLLRLIVRLPDILPRMALTEVKRKVIMNYVDILLQYLATQNNLFAQGIYRTSPDKH